MESIKECITENTKKMLKEHLEEKFGTSNFTFTIEIGSNAGDNYFGVVYRIAAKQNDTSTPKIINLILKVPPQNPMRRKQFLSKQNFLRESMVYDKILPMFHEFQKSEGLTENCQYFYEFPKCFKTITTEFQEAIVLEDLTHGGFFMFDRFKELTFDRVAHVMKVLGKFHAISFAIKDQCIEKLKPFMQLEDMFLNHDPQTLMQLFLALVDRAKSTISAKGNKHLVKKFEAFFEDQNIGLNLLMVNGPNAEPYSVICHGDCWTNNIMFKDENDKTIDLRILDWQMTRYASPAVDLSYFFFCCTTKSLRDKHYDDLIKIYHQNLCEMLERLGSNATKVFPFSALDEQLHKFGRYGLIMAVLLLPMFTSFSGEIPDLDKLSMDAENKQLKTADLFKSKNTTNPYEQRMRDVIIDMDRLGYF